MSITPRSTDSINMLSRTRGTKRSWKTGTQPQQEPDEDVTIALAYPLKRTRLTQEPLAAGAPPIPEFDVISIDSSDSDCSVVEDQIQLDSKFPDSAASGGSPTPQGITRGDLTMADRGPEEPIRDVCFGVITLEGFKIGDYFYPKREKIKMEVLLEVNGIMAIIRCKENTYGGLLGQKAAEVVVGLIKGHDVELSASMKTQESIEVLIYGRHDQGDAIGDMLMEKGYYLQQPDSHDDPRPYYNPQCLSHFEDEGITPCGGGGSLFAQPRALDEAKKDKVTELLDCATGPSDFRRVQISDLLTTYLKSHQTKALSMMVEKESGNICGAEFPSVWTEDPDARASHLRFYNTVTRSYTTRKPRLCLGGLLADEMGLGKTLTTLALIATSLRNGNGERQAANMTLVICPMTTITCWQDQIDRHFKSGSLRCSVYHGPSKDLDDITPGNVDIVLTTYETLRAGLLDEGVMKKRGKGYKPTGRLHDIDWHRVVLDEAHIIRNRSSQIFHAVNTLKAKHRWCLTGTPIQNRLEDLGSLVEFLKVDPFANPNAFRNTFLAPIDNEQKYGWERLRSLVRSIALRRTKTTLGADLKLPAKRETIHWVNLNDVEKEMYNLVKRYFVLAIDSGGKTMTTFQFILRLRQICNHGSDLLPQSLRTWLQQAAKFGVAPPPQLSMCEVCGIALDEEVGASHQAFPCFHQVCQACTGGEDIPDLTRSVCPLCNVDEREGIDEGVESEMDPKTRSAGYRPSSKVKALLENLRRDRQAAAVSGRPPPKSVVFSTWTSMLDLIGTALSMNSFIYQRLDGGTSLPQRRRALDDFRDDSNCTVLLASLGSAAVGLDLTMATRVHLMEPGWNPLLEQQAIDRIHRLGQDSDVVTTRYIVSGLGSDSIEQYILQRQAWKMDLIVTSLDESRAHANEAETIIKAFALLNLRFGGSGRTARRSGSPGSMLEEQ